jgi:hypothetical protein
MQSHPNPASPLEYSSCKLYNLKYAAYLEHKGGVDDDAISKHWIKLQQQKKSKKLPHQHIEAIWTYHGHLGVSVMAKSNSVYPSLLSHSPTKCEVGALTRKSPGWYEHANIVLSPLCTYMFAENYFPSMNSYIDLRRQKEDYFTKSLATKRIVKLQR